MTQPGFIQQLKQKLFFYQTYKIKRYSRKSTYTGMLSRKIPRDKIKTVIELGARDLRDTFAIKLHYNPKTIYAFEANPVALSICDKTLKKYWMFRDGIFLIPKAVWNEEKVIKFYSVQDIKSKPGDKKVNANIGSSACFGQTIHTTGEEVIQKEVDVEAVRLDSFCAKNGVSEIDLLCMDIEGAEYNALIGLGDYISKVNFIITELYFKPVRSGQACFDVVEPFLKNKGFILLDTLNDGNPQYSNFLFARSEIARA